MKWENIRGYYYLQKPWVPHKFHNVVRFPCAPCYSEQFRNLDYVQHDPTSTEECLPIQISRKFTILWHTWVSATALTVVSSFICRRRDSTSTSTACSNVECNDDSSSLIFSRIPHLISFNRHRMWYMCSNVAKQRSLKSRNSFCCNSDTKDITSPVHITLAN